MFKVRQAKAKLPTPPRPTRIRRTSSRRSGYAFSHAQGYGDLVMSGRYLRRPAVSRSSGFAHTGRATTGFSPMGRSAGYSPTGRPQNVKVPDVQVTSLQMYRTITDWYNTVTVSTRSGSALGRCLEKIWEQEVTERNLLWLSTELHVKDFLKILPQRGLKNTWFLLQAFYFVGVNQRELQQNV